MNGLTVKGAFGFQVTSLFAQESFDRHVLLQTLLFMQASSLLRKFGRDLVYLSIIGVVAAWIWGDTRRQKVWNDMAVSDLKEANSIVDYMLERYTLAMERGYNNHPSTQADDYSKRGFKSRHLLDTVFAQKIAQFQERVTDDSGNCFRSLSNQELKSLEKEALLVTDSISKLMDGIPDMNPKIWNCLFGDNLWLKAQSVSPSQTKMFLQSLIFRSKLLHREAIGYFSTRVFDDNFHGFWTPMIPFVEAEKTTPFKGETYHAQIYLCRRYLSDLSTAIRVDGKLLPLGGYGSVFTAYCDTPGEKKHSIAFEIKNPVTGRIEYRDMHGFFSYTVVDSCR